MKRSRLAFAVALACSVGMMGMSQWAAAQAAAGARPPMEQWQHRPQGISPNAALAFYRLQQSRAAGTANSPWRQSAAYTATAPAPRPSATFGGNPYYQNRQFPRRKPFDDYRPAPNAVERYWPYLLEGREDPDTGIIIWRLP